MTSAEATRRAVRLALLQFTRGRNYEAAEPLEALKSAHEEEAAEQGVIAAIDLAVLSARVEQMQWVLDQSPRYHDEELIEERDRLRRELEEKGR